MLYLSLCDWYVLASFGHNDNKQTCINTTTKESNVLTPLFAQLRTSEDVHCKIGACCQSLCVKMTGW